jgi:hypothetical protein
MIYPTKDEKYDVDVWNKNFREVESELKKKNDGVYTLNLSQDGNGNRTYSDGTTFDDLLNACMKGTTVVINDNTTVKYGFICVDVYNDEVVLNRCFANDDLGGTIYVEIFSFSPENISLRTIFK